MANRVLSLIVFPGGFNLPLWAGMSQGFYARRGLELKLRSPRLDGAARRLIRGDWDIGLTGFDNVVAYQEGQGEAAIDRAPDLRLHGRRRRVPPPRGAEGYREYADLSRQDALGRRAHHRLCFRAAEDAGRERPGRENDVNFERAGGVMQRWEALKAGKHAGTLFDHAVRADRAKARSPPAAKRQRCVSRAIRASVGATRRSWAAAHGEALTGFIRGFLASLAWLHDRENKSAAVALLVEKIPNIAEARGRLRHLRRRQGDSSPRRGSITEGIEDRARLAQRVRPAAEGADRSDEIRRSQLLRPRQRRQLILQGVGCERRTNRA